MVVDSKVFLHDFVLRMNLIEFKLRLNHAFNFVTSFDKKMLLLQSEMHYNMNIHNFRKILLKILL